MKNKRQRQKAILEIISNQEIGNQDDLLSALVKIGYVPTQATLSRDLKEMRVIKQPSENGKYVYQIHHSVGGLSNLAKKEKNVTKNSKSVSFSGNLAVVKTKPGYASGVAIEIDALGFPCILGTIAGDDTVLIIMTENADRGKVENILNHILEIQ